MAKQKVFAKNPWISIWTQPRKTLAQILAYNPRHRFVLLSGISGLASLLYGAQSYSLGMYFPVWSIIIGALILAIPVGMLMIIISTFFLYWTGKLFKGKGNFLSVRCAVTWSNVPNVVNLILWGILFSIFDGFMFLNTNLCVSGDCLILAIIYLLMIAIGIWTFIILICNLSEAQKFSRWRAFFNLILVSVIFGIINGIVMGITMAASP